MKGKIMKLATRKETTKRHQKIIAKGQDWLDKGFTPEVVAAGLWNKMGARTEVKNGKVIIWGRFSGKNEKLFVVAEL